MSVSCIIKEELSNHKIPTDVLNLLLQYIVHPCSKEIKLLSDIPVRSYFYEEQAGSSSGPSRFHSRVMMFYRTKLINMKIRLKENRYKPDGGRLVNCEYNGEDVSYTWKMKRRYRSYVVGPNGPRYLDSEEYTVGY